MQDKNIHMSDDFSKLFEIIMDKFIQDMKGGRSLPALARFLGHEHKGKVTAWSKGQWPSARDCWVLHTAMGFPLEWLLTGNSLLLKNDSQSMIENTMSDIEAMALRNEVTTLREHVEALKETVFTQKKLLAMQSENYRLLRESMDGHASQETTGTFREARGAYRSGGLQEEPAGKYLIKKKRR